MAFAAASAVRKWQNSWSSPSIECRGFHNGNPRNPCNPVLVNDRFKAWLIGWAGFLIIHILGRTIRWESSGDSYLDDIYKSGNRAIFTFWHGRIFPATYYWRNRGIVVMTSMNRDGEAIAQCIQRFGFGVARGSSSRGGFRALAQMARDIRMSQ